MTPRLPGLTSPVPLTPGHDLEGFSSGVAPLDEWLKSRAQQNEVAGGSRTFVLCAAGRVIGYYSLAASSLLPAAATGRVRRNMPDPIPVILLGRLALDAAWTGRGFGADLLRDAILRSLAAGTVLGARAIMVHAISAEAKAFYEKHGFKPSPIDPMTLMITLEEARRALAP